MGGHQMVKVPTARSKAKGLRGGNYGQGRELHQGASEGVFEVSMLAPTISKLRDDIDRGRTGDKIAWPDPAVAPLGTDEEAAGTPIPPEAVAQAHAYELREVQHWPRPADPNLHVVRMAAYSATTIGAVLGGIWLVWYAIK